MMKSFVLRLKHIIPILFATILVIGCASSVASAETVKNIKVDVPQYVVAEKGKNCTVKGTFSGQGISKISITPDKGMTTSTKVTWKAYPNKCPIQISVKTSTPAKFVIRLYDSRDNVIKKHTVSVGIKQTNYVGKVTAKSGLYYRSTPVNGKINGAFPYNKEIKISAIFKGSDGRSWGKVDNKGYVCMDYVKKVTSTSSSSKIKYNRNATLQFAKKHVYTNSTWLCAEYVARSLNAGGYKLNVATSKTVGGLVSNLTKTNTGKLIKLTVNKDGRILSTGNKGKIAVGDPLFIYCHSEVDGKPYVHTVLVSDLNGSKGIKVYAHNRAYNNQVYWGFKNTCSYCTKAGRTPKTSVYAYHINN